MSDNKQSTLPAKPAQQKPAEQPTKQPAEKKPEAKEPEVTEYVIMERRDEEQITEELRGELVDQWVYSFKVAGREVTGLSWVGVKQAVRHYGHIHVALVSEQETDDEYRVTVKAIDTLVDVEMLGTASQSKMFLGKPDPFARVKALNKASRNAYRALLPERVIIEIMKEWKEGKR